MDFIFLLGAVAPKGPMTYAFTHIRDFIIFLPHLHPLKYLDTALRPKSHHRGLIDILKAQIQVFGGLSPEDLISALLINFLPQCPNSGHKSHSAPELTP